MDVKTAVLKMTENIEKVLVGKRRAVELVLTALLAGGHVLIEDVPGVGKTSLANALAKTIDCGFTRIQFTPDTLPSDVTGVSIYNMQSGTFEFSKGAVMNHIILADEINRTSPKTQASLLEAMEEGQVTVDGTTYPLPSPFMVIATQNPIDYLGTYNLPEAQLDRFMLKFSIGYPDAVDERAMLARYISAQPLNELQPVTDGDTILALQKAVREVSVHPDVMEYIVQIVAGTRTHRSLSLGASPRAGIALAHAAQATAAMQGRDFVIPDDVKAMVSPVLFHRLVLTPEARLEHQTTKSILDSILSGIKVPVF
ncbi:MAG: MoxR family ATPase [Clostridiaceae bacterium]|nr:MoxR family ATPase [Clostridiaceae bacterium]